MKKMNRLLKNNDFKRVMNYNHREKTPEMLVFIKPNNLSYMRVGLSVSKKIGKAHLRVKIRRQLRAYFSLIKMYNICCDVVVVIRIGYLSKSFEENKEILKKNLDILIKGEKIDD